MVKDPLISFVVPTYIPPFPLHCNTFVVHPTLFAILDTLNVLHAFILFIKRLNTLGCCQIIQPLISLQQGLPDAKKPDVAVEFQKLVSQWAPEVVKRLKKENRKVTMVYMILSFSIF